MKRNFYYNKILFNFNLELFSIRSKKFKEIYLNNNEDIYIEDNEFSLNSFKSFLLFMNNNSHIDIDINILKNICIKWECNSLLNILNSINIFNNFNKKILFNKKEFLINSIIFENETNINLQIEINNNKFSYEDFQDFLDFLHSKINYKNKFEIYLLCEEFKCENLIKLINFKNLNFILNKFKYFIDNIIPFENNNLFNYISNNLYFFIDNPIFYQLPLNILFKFFNNNKKLFLLNNNLFESKGNLSLSYFLNYNNQKKYISNELIFNNY